ncbi:MAG: hypothetical protein H0T46_34605 [Deltaproteobacteria bacterium]|nr:hypothetical protein [Deltaproteobacteria bacterium]
MSHPSKELKGPQPDADVEPIHHLPAVEGSVQDPEAAWKAIEEILAGKSDASKAAKLAARLDAPQKETLAEKLPDLAKVATGDIVLAVGEVVPATKGSVVNAAMSAARAKPTASRLQRFLLEIDGPNLGALTDAHALELERMFAGQPMLQVCPRASVDLGFERKPSLLRWVVRSTPPVILADMMGANGTQQLGQALDEHKLWRPWIDHVRHAHDRYQYLAAGTSDPAVRAKLLAPFGARATVDNSGSIEVREPAEAEAAGEIDAAVATGASRARLIEALNAANSIPEAKVATVQGALQRMGAPADDVLAVALRFTPPAMSWLGVLAAAPGVTSSHVLAFSGRATIDIENLGEPLVRQLRAHLGATFHLSDLVRRDDAKSHRTIVESEALRQWFLDKASPSDLLWFCTQTPDVITRATRIVVARFPDFAWVRKLGGKEDEAQLRALALATNDEATKKFIREELLHDQKVTGKAHEGAEVSSKAFGGEGNRFTVAIRLGDPDVIMERLADLDEAQRRAFGKDPAAVAEVAAILGEQFARAAHLMELSAEASLANARGPSVLPHVHGRPPAEQVKALAKPEVVAHVAKHVFPDLLVVFPSLANRATLAKAIDDNPQLVEHLLRGGDGSRVMDMLAMEPVATAAIAAFEQDGTRLRLVPAFDHLSSAGQAFVARIRKTPDADPELRTESKHVIDRTYASRMKHADHDPDQQRALEHGKAASEASEAETLTEALDQLFADKDGKPRHGPSNVLSLLAARKAEVPTLLDEGAHALLVARIARETQLPPHLAIPFISAELLLQMPNALHWYFTLDDPMVLLHLVARPNAANTVGQNLGADTTGARTWLKRVPHGAALTAEERRMLDLLQRATQNGEVLRQLFITRFDVTPPPLETPDGKPDARGAGFNAHDLDSLYRIASRLPPSHVNQKRINRIAAQDTVDGAGSWDGQLIKVDPEYREGTDTTTMHNDVNAKQADEGWLTREEVIRDFGYDDARIAAQVKAKNLLEREVDGTMFYKMKPVEIDTFTQVVLHEIGHSVDDMLGRHTSLVFQEAGWRQFKDDQFAEWAAEMGGWDKVSKPDQAKIKEAWVQASRVQKPVGELVDRDHPAMSQTYQGVGIVEAGRDGASFVYGDRTIRNGRMFVAGSYPGQWSSLKAEAVPSAPSTYSLYAPGEYFAESYVEYYRNVDGSPGSEKKKGGGLNSGAKKFFDEKVDTLKYDPRRFESKTED